MKKKAVRGPRTPRSQDLANRTKENALRNARALPTDRELEPKWLPLLDAFRNPTEGFRTGILKIRSMFDGPFWGLAA